MITHKIVNVAEFDETGTQVGSKTYEQKESKVKRGFRLMYLSELETVVKALSKSNLEMMINIYKEVDSTGKINLNQKDYIDKYGGSKGFVSKGFKALWDEKIISDTKGDIYFNPYVFTPPLNVHKKDSIAVAQKNWEKEIGYYEN